MIVCDKLYLYMHVHVILFESMCYPCAVHILYLHVPPQIPHPQTLFPFLMEL